MVTSFRIPGTNPPRYVVYEDGERQPDRVDQPADPPHIVRLKEAMLTGVMGGREQAEEGIRAQEGDE